MTDLKNWLLLFHLFFMIAWMVGIFYLPRMMVHYQEAVETGQGTERIVIMARKLYTFTSIMMILLIGCGTSLWLFCQTTAGGWIHVKLVLVGFFIIHHHLCGRFVKQMTAGTLKRSSIFFRWFNELPVFVLLAILILAIIKPF